MKYLYLLIILSTAAFGQNQLTPAYQVYQTDSDSDISNLEARSHDLKNLKSKVSIDRIKRDKLLNRYFGDKYKKMDELDKDLFIKRALHLSKSQFEKYYKLSSKDYSQLTKDIKVLK
jgi:hypothetical protein